MCAVDERGSSVPSPCVCPPMWPNAFAELHLWGDGCVQPRTALASQRRLDHQAAGLLPRILGSTGVPIQDELPEETNPCHHLHSGISDRSADSRGASGAGAISRQLV